MRFKVTVLLPIISELPSEYQQTPQNTQSSYIARGDHMPISNLIRNLQEMIDDQERENDEHLSLMMQIAEEETGLLSIGIQRRNLRIQRPRFEPNFRMTKVAIADYEQAQKHLSCSLRKNIQIVKRNRQFYQKFKEETKSHSIIISANSVIMNLLKVGLKQPASLSCQCQLQNQRTRQFAKPNISIQGQELQQKLQTLCKQS